MERFHLPTHQPSRDSQAEQASLGVQMKIGLQGAGQFQTLGSGTSLLFSESQTFLPTTRLFAVNVASQQTLGSSLGT